jgi:hypothetical protein
MSIKKTGYIDHKIVKSNFDKFAKILQSILKPYFEYD